MIDIENLEVGEFHQMPLVVEGESKEVRYAGEGLAVIALKPTIYSYTHNRTGIIPGSEIIRLRAIQSLMPVILEAGLQHTYKEVNDRWILSELVVQPEVAGDKTPFRPDDLTEKEIKELPIAPPIEVIAKALHTGTSKHRYFNLSNWPTRNGGHIAIEGLYPEPVIRFDWRNPMRHPATSERLADEILTDQMADWFIDTETAKSTARLAFAALSSHMSPCGMDLWDICFFVSEDGQKLFGEISPDCMRVRAENSDSLDKDVWRAGGSSEAVLEKWQMMLDKMKRPTGVQ